MMLRDTIFKIKPIPTAVETVRHNAYAIENLVNVTRNACSNKGLALLKMFVTYENGGTSVANRRKITRYIPKKLRLEKSFGFWATRTNAPKIDKPKII